MTYSLEYGIVNKKGVKMNLRLADGTLIACSVCNKPMGVVRHNKNLTMVQLECKRCKMDKYMVLLGGESVSNGTKV